MFYQRKLSGLPVCNPYKMVACAIPVYNAFISNPESEVDCNCIHPCEEMHFTVSVSQARLPQKQIAPLLQEKFGRSDEYIRKNLVVLNIYYGDLSYIQINQDPAYPGASAFGEIGGQMGLCLGASILTVAEFVEFMALLCMHCCKSENFFMKIHVAEQK